MTMRSIANRLLPALIPVVVGLVLLSRGNRWGLAPIVVGVVLVLPVVGPAVRSGIARAALALGQLVGFVVLVIVNLVAVLPVWLAGRILRVDPLGDGSGGGWRKNAALDLDTSEHRQFRPVRPPRGRVTVVQRAWNVVGLIVVLLLLDFGGGWAWDLAQGETVIGGSTVDIAVPVLPGPLELAPTTTEPPFQTGQIAADDSRVQQSLWKDVPWAREYFWGVDANARMAYPFLGDKPVPLRSPYFNVSGWERASYIPAAAADDPEALPQIWFFGGSTMFGMGQRDEHTIASEIARISEEQGVPVTVRNFGQPRWLNWQEMLLFEQLLATEPTPQFAVFYDGVNDVDNQLIHPFDQPSEHLFNGALDFDPPSGPPDPVEPVVDQEPFLDRLWNEYAAHSLAYKVWGKLVPDAGAQQDRDSDNLPDTQAEAEALAKRVHDIYARGRDLISLMADEHDVSVSFFWQPQALDVSWFNESQKLVDPPTIDLTHVLDGQDVYYDTMHTVESGARMVAEAQWETLGPQVRAWYEDHR